jgi:hypothetical protein
MSEQARERSREVQPRLLLKQQAAAYCGVCSAVFEKACPVKPIRLLNRIPRWDRFALDAWIDGLTKSEVNELDPLRMWDDSRTAARA